MLKVLWYNFTGFESYMGFQNDLYKCILYKIWFINRENYLGTCMQFWKNLYAVLVFLQSRISENGCSTKCSIFCSQMNDKYLWPGVYMHYLVQNCFPVVILMALYIYVPMCVCCVSVCVFPCRFLYTCLYSCSLIIHLFSPTTTTT